eukprot:CAMPEP_0172672130 /NCGR_PEP_ID=MMETSP1074-20121228/11363_1 /TAXON_ID=2916 /ORGANISM="Ceratium fusus, Strain PA161109" /LENGTH=291 /DNA_ID=CAMNT_0013489283 /DNA_START=65 /DNA_END=940 /DNA_ORIENTATION=+
MTSRTNHLRRRSPTASRLLIACVAVTSLGGCGMSAMFVQGSLCTINKHYSATDKTQVHAFPWEASTQTNSASAEKVYAVFVSKFAQAAENGNYLGTSCTKADVLQRFRALSQTVGEDIAVDMACKEPIVLLQESLAVRGSFDYLKSLETSNEQGLALQILQKNPKLLTIPQFEFQRTKPSLQSLATSASAIDFLRPLGEGGLAIAIFGSFIVLLIVLRPILFGVKGQQSLVGMLLAPITTAFPVLTSFSPVAFREFLEGYGISLPALVALIPAYQVLNAIINQAGAGKQRQ